MGTLERLVTNLQVAFRDGSLRSHCCSARLWDDACLRCHLLRTMVLNGLLSCHPPIALSWLKYIFYANNIKCQVRFILPNSLPVLPYNFWMITVSFSIFTSAFFRNCFQSCCCYTGEFSYPLLLWVRLMFFARCKPPEDKLLELGWLLLKDEHEAVDVLSLWSVHLVVQVALLL